jgi:hypothetical protein
MTMPVAGPPPTVVEVRAWLKLSTDQVSDHDLDVIRDAEIANQTQECRIPADLAAVGLLPAPLVATVYRRCARAVAARGVPLGYRSGDDEYGPMRLPSYDAEISRLEGPLRRFVFG